MTRTTEGASSEMVAGGVGGREAEVLLGALARVKAGRFGRLVITVSDGRIVDVEVVEKIDRDRLRSLSM